MILLSVVAAIAGLFGFPGAGGDLQTGSLNARAITIVESSHRIEFPDRIVFTLEADAPPDVQSARLYYTVGPHDVKVYTYPVRFTNSENIEAEFIVNTGKDGFIPQGVEIEYYYVFTDSLGNLTVSDSRTFEYLDPRYDWRRLSMDDFTIIWHNRPERVVRRTAADVSIRMRAVRELFGLEGNYDFKAVIINSRAEADRSFPPVSDTSQDTFLYGGFAFNRYDVLVVAGLNRDSLIHELTHLMFDERLDSPRAKPPAWLNEGIAMYFEPGGGYRQSDVQRAFRSGNLIPLRHMRSVPGRPDDVRLFYSQSASVVRFMMDEFGPERMDTLLTEINEGRKIDEALIATYGVGVDELDRGWRRYLAGETSIFQIRDPGALGTSAIIGAALLVTTSAVLIRWLKNLRKSSQPTDDEEEL
ncbi:MAG: hypothetical protein F4Y49_02390 [Dehalococcoidia bacterium]|nr:hypothetical protein [Dehalococcoidia bacterium]